MKQNNQNRKKPVPKAPVYERPSATQQRQQSLAIEKPMEFPLERTNFILMAIAAAVIILGFLLMLGKGSTTEAFNPDIFSTRRIVVGPTIAFLGFLFMGFAIIYRKKETKTVAEADKQEKTDESGHA